jgi:hypothetical protein
MSDSKDWLTSEEIRRRHGRIILDTEQSLLLASFRYRDQDL